jgi:uncharacterized hydrophobic protein (TIGR00271 family)
MNSSGSHDDTSTPPSDDLPRTEGAVRLINLEIFGASAAMARVATRLDQLGDVSRVRVVDATRSGQAVLTATIRPQAVDSTLDEVRRLGVPDSSTTLTRVEVIGSLVTGRAAPSLVWADVLGTAWLNARPIARYLAFMVAAGVIGGYGVIDDNSILIVGAMAVSPDLLPITAVGVGIVARQTALAGRALLTLTVGLGVAAIAACAVAFLQDLFDVLPSNFNVEVTGVLGGLTSVSNETITVALVAGIAGMLALETRASAGVGVAISVTTIPAAAYLGVAAGVGELDVALGALGVLGANVAMMVVGAVGTLAFQSLLTRRALEKRRRGGIHSEASAES